MKAQSIASAACNHFAKSSFWSGCILMGPFSWTPSLLSSLKCIQPIDGGGLCNRQYLSFLFFLETCRSQQSRCVLKRTRSAPPNDACLLPVHSVKLSVNITVSLHGDLWCSHAWVNRSLAQLKCIRVSWLLLPVRMSLPSFSPGRQPVPSVSDTNQASLPLAYLPPLPSSIHGLDCAAVGTHTHTHSPTEHRFLSPLLLSLYCFFVLFRFFISKHLMLLVLQKGGGGRGQLMPNVIWFEYTVYAEGESGFMNTFSSHQLMWRVLIKLEGKTYMISIHLKREDSCK